MSYLFPIGSTTETGVVEVGGNINVLDGIISIPQSVATTANVTFENITANSNANIGGNITVIGNIGAVGDITGNALFDSNNRVITKITPTANAGISITGITSNGPNAAFTVTNTGVLSLTAGTGITLSGSTGNITVIGNIGAVGDISGSALFDSNNRVITKITPTANAGISITGITSNGPNAAFTVTNTGVLSLTAGTGITLSGSTGNITVSATGADLLNTIGVTTNYTATATDEYIGVDSTTLVTVTLPPGINGRQYIIKEEHGAGTGKVNVQGTALETIDGSPFKQLTALASLSVVFRAGQWRII